MDIADIRRKNLAALVDKYTLAGAGKKFKKPDRQLGDMIAGRKSFGEKVAMQMEKNYAPNYPSGWLSSEITIDPDDPEYKSSDPTSQLVEMHKSMERLYKAAKDLKGISSPSNLGRAINASPQAIKNWEKRGVSKEGMLTAQRIIGCSAVWIETGSGEMRIGEGVELLTQDSGYISLDLLNVEAAAGDGRNDLEFPEVVQRINVLESWAHSALGGDLSRINLITAHGTSMQGTIENGDVLFVDATVRSYDGDGIYVIARDKDIQVKRLQKLHGNMLAVISDNQAYESEYLSEEAANSIIVCGRVLAAWSIHKFW